ncbi:MAG TPA: amidohydrolase family protein [Thermoanaerobaculia bacterium]|nr:amidohydrolase family protein [Thermoanaerobaculia bacterium]
MGEITPPVLVDCDLHCEVPRVEALFPYLAEHWIEHIQNTMFKGASVSYYPRRSPVAARPGSLPDGGGPAGSSLELLRAQALDEAGVEIGILGCLYAVDSVHNPDVALAMASAVNDWQRAEWLDREPRLRGSIVVPVQIPELAAREIDRVADDPRFVQVLLPVRTEHPLGSRLYRPLWEAIVRHRLVAAIHFGGAPVQPPTPTGWPSYYLEEYVAMAQVFATQLTSLVVEGVFDLHPSLRVALLESGFTWLPAHLWRFDKEWRNLRRQVPWVKRAPSEYVREQVRVSIQPLDAPPEPRQLVEIVDQLGSDDMLLYASDYPHRHAFDVETDLLAHLPEASRRKIRSENARALYRL